MNTTPFTQNHLEEALGYVGVDDAEIYVDYSGRGMYGATCFGIVHDSHDTIIALVIAHALHIALLEQGDDDHDDVMESATEILRSACGDSMGRQHITYFPGWELPQES